MANRWVIALYKAMPRSLTSRMVHALKPTFPIGVVAVVFDAEERVLLLKHTYHSPPWRLPGGLMEKSETPEQTAVREMREEANCTIEPVAVVDAANVRYSFDVAVLARLVQTGPFRPNAEVTDVQWFALNSLPPMPDSQVRFIHRARTFLTAGTHSKEES